MWDTIQFILLLTAYIATAYFIIWLIKKYTADTNKYLRLLTLSFVYALFWGLGIAGNGGDPGFAFPAPNIVALGLMASIGFYRGILTGLIILGFWWVIIFVVMFVRQTLRNKKVIRQEQQQ
jgi:hypothetical protein